MNYLVSIIIPTYNRAELLKETINSILAQTYTNFEVIIVSDASLDHTSTLVNSFKDKRIIFFQLSKNLKYPSKVRNWGFTKASGDFIAFCDDDDLWLPKKLETQIAEFKKNENLNLICSRAMLFPGYPRILGHIQFKNHIVNYPDLLRDNKIVTSSVVMRADIFKALDGFDENEELHIGEDWDLWLRILRQKNNSILLMKSCLVKYRIGNFKITNTYANIHEIESRYKYLYRKHLPNSKELLDTFNVTKVYELLPESSEDKLRTFIIAQKVFSKELQLRELLLSDQINIKLKDRIAIVGKLVYKIFAFYLLRTISH